MRLLTKITLLYLLITLAVFAVGGIMAYFVMMKEIEAEHQRFLRQRLQRTIELIRQGEQIQSYDGDKLEVQPLRAATAEMPFRYSDTLVWHPYLRRMENHYKVSTIVLVNGQYYYLETYDVIVEADDISEAVVSVLSRIFLLLLVVVGVIGVLISARIFRPFNVTLDRVRAFRVQDREPLRLPHTNTREFGRLNRLLEYITEKSRRDYQSLKEFSENASHEIQTPLAIARGKLELLLESPHLNDRELDLVLAALKAVNKLSRLGHALSLLTKIENEEFAGPRTADLTALLRHALSQFDELAELKALRLQSTIAEGVQLGIDPALADILLGNLLQNAIRHNVEGGWIDLRLDPGRLCVKNTGRPPQAPVEELFQRFRKDRQSSDSLGLGLAIVKRICDRNGISIQYRYNEGVHSVELRFPDIP